MEDSHPNNSNSNGNGNGRHSPRRYRHPLRLFDSANDDDESDEYTTATPATQATSQTGQTANSWYDAVFRPPAALAEEEEVLFVDPLAVDATADTTVDTTAMETSLETSLASHPMPSPLVQQQPVNPQQQQQQQQKKQKKYKKQLGNKAKSLLSAKRKKKGAKKKAEPWAGQKKRKIPDPALSSYYYYPPLPPHKKESSSLFDWIVENDVKETRRKKAGLRAGRMTALLVLLLLLLVALIVVTTRKDSDQQTQLRVEQPEQQQEPQATMNDDDEPKEPPLVPAPVAPPVTTTSTNSPTSSPPVSSFIWHTWEPTTSTVQEEATTLQPTETATETATDTEAPSLEPTTTPTLLPTEMPSTETPTLAPTEGPSDLPSTVPTAWPTVQPTALPTVQPTTTSPVTPTLTPTATKLPPGQAPPPTVTYIIGDVPYTPREQMQLPNQLRRLPADADWLIHVGDILPSHATDCNRTYYAWLAETLTDTLVTHRQQTLQLPAVPATLVLGDNEWNDCRNPVKGYRHWMEHFGNESNWAANFDGGTSKNNKVYPRLQYWNDYPEAFHYRTGSTLWVGLNLVGGIVHKVDEWQRRLRGQYNRLSSLINDNDRRPDRVVIIAHANPNQHHSAFFNPLAASIGQEWSDIQFLYINGDKHEWNFNNQFMGRPNWSRLMVVGGTKEAPLRVEVHHSNDDDSDEFRRPFRFQRKSYEW